jgi:hypothetical protein
MFMTSTICLNMTDSLQPDSDLPTLSSPLAKKPHGLTVVCDSKVCENLQFNTDQGQWQLGKEVSRTTRSNHHKKDRLAAEAIALPAEPEVNQAEDRVTVEDAEVDRGPGRHGFDPQALVEDDDRAYSTLIWH